MDDSREYPSRPICGVGVVIRKGDAILLIRRGREPRRGEWGLPGGMVKLGETLREAAQREVREECGIEITLGDVIDAADVVHRDENGRVQFHYVVVDLVAAYKSGEIKPTSDAVDTRWVPFHDLDSYSLPTKVSAVIEKALVSTQE